jgi:hypothetical protein
MIDIFTSEDMENISLCIFQYLTLYYIIIKNIFMKRWVSLSTIVQQMLVNLQLSE